MIYRDGIYYAIRRRGTDQYMCVLKGRMRGYTCRDLSSFGIPRLFSKLHSAKVALTWWLQGSWEFGGESGYNFNRQYNRPKREDMEIVLMSLQPLSKTF